MTLKLFLIALLFNLSSCRKSIVMAPQEECDRIRKPMHLLSEDQLMLYVDGLQQIRMNGKYQIMVDAHSKETEIHRGTSFFFYHTYFVWEVETQIRALGSKWSCFAVPCYDWTIDAGRERNPLILNTVFGGDGDKTDFNCVTDPHHKNLWGVSKWPVQELCGPHEDSDAGCCLKRNLDPTQRLAVAQKIAPMVEVPFFHEFLGDILMEHQVVHWLFGSGESCTNCAMATGYSPDDPIFMMLHGFTAYLRALWAACHGYDNIDPRKLDQHPEAFSAECIDGYEDCGAIELDDTYKFGGMVDTIWSLTASQKITPRAMWDFASWNVKYDHGTFYDESGLRNSDICDRLNIENSRWFTKLTDDHPTTHENNPKSAHSADKSQKPEFGAKEAEHPRNMENDVEEMSVKYHVKAITVPKPGNTATILMICTLLLLGATYMLYGSSMWECFIIRIKMRNSHIASPYKYDKMNVNDMVDIEEDDEMYGAIEL